MLATKLSALSRELELITSNGWDPTFCLRKLAAAADNDIEAYCDTLEEELELKSERVTELERAGDLSAEITRNLRNRIAADEAAMAELRASHEELFAEFKTFSAIAAGTAAGTVAGLNAAAAERLIANLEAENIRQTRRAEAAEARATAAEGELARIKKATWVE